MVNPIIRYATCNFLPRLTGQRKIPKGVGSDLLKGSDLKNNIDRGSQPFLIGFFASFCVVLSSSQKDKNNLDKIPFSKLVALNAFNIDVDIEMSIVKKPSALNQDVLFGVLKDMVYFGVARGVGSIVLAQPFQRLMSLSQRGVPFKDSVKIVFSSIKSPYQGATSNLLYFGFIGAALYPCHGYLSQNLDSDSEKCMLKAMLAFFVYAVATPLDQRRFQAATQKIVPNVNQAFSNQVFLFGLNGFVGIVMEGLNDVVKTVVLTQDYVQTRCLQAGLEPTEFVKVVLGALASNVVGYPFFCVVRQAYINGFDTVSIRLDGIVARSIVSRLCVVEASYLGFYFMKELLDYTCVKINTNPKVCRSKK